MLTSPNDQETACNSEAEYLTEFDVSERLGVRVNRLLIIPPNVLPYEPFAFFRLYRLNDVIDFETQYRAFCQIGEDEAESETSTH